MLTIEKEFEDPTGEGIAKMPIGTSWFRCTNWSSYSPTVIPSGSHSISKIHGRWAGRMCTKNWRNLRTGSERGAITSEESDMMYSATVHLWRKSSFLTASIRSQDASPDVPTWERSHFQKRSVSVRWISKDVTIWGQYITRAPKKSGTARLLVRPLRSWAHRSTHCLGKTWKSYLKNENPVPPLSPYISRLWRQLVQFGP